MSPCCPTMDDRKMFLQRASSQECHQPHCPRRKHTRDSRTRHCAHLTLCRVVARLVEEERDPWVTNLSECIRQLHRGSPVQFAQCPRHRRRCNLLFCASVKSRGSLNVPIPKHCGTLFLVPHCCVWVLEPSGESTAQAVPLHYNCVRTLGSYLAVMFNTPPSKLGNDFPKSELVSKLLSLRKQTAKH